MKMRRRVTLPPAGLPMPDSVVVESRRLKVSDSWRATRAVVGYPREVRLGWAEPLVTHAGPVDVAFHVEPIPTRVAADRLRRQLARLESSRRLDATKGRLVDADLEVSAEDARDLAHQLARGEGRLFSFGLYATARGDDPDDLETQTERLRAVLDSLLLDSAPTTFRAVAGWLTTLPLGLDLVRQHRTVDTAALAAAFPFGSGELTDAGGALYGRNVGTGGLVFWDRWRRPNYNEVILARSGSGKSFLAKLELLRWLYQGVEAFVIDPEDEYRLLTEAVGGVHLRLGTAGVRLNPFDLDDEPDALTRRALFLHTLLGLLLGGEPSPAGRAALDRAIVAAYEHRGITDDPATHRRPAPTLADLSHELDTSDADGRELAARLAPFTTGTHRRLFDGPTTMPASGHLVVFGLRDLPREMKPAGVLLALDSIWRQVSGHEVPRRRMVLVDEAWWLMQDEAGARFLQQLAKAARKRWVGLTFVSQDAADLLSTDLGLAVVSNASTQILMGQAPQAIAALASAFGLSEGERRFLLSAQPGEALLLGDGERVAFRSIASPAERALVTTDPAEATQ